MRLTALSDCIFFVNEGHKSLENAAFSRLFPCSLWCPVLLDFLKWCPWCPDGARFLAHKFLTLLQTARLALDVNHGAVMQDAVQDSGGGGDVCKDLVPLGEGLVGGKDGGCSWEGSRSHQYGSQNGLS